MERRGDNKIVINSGNNKCHLSNFCPWPCTMPLSVLSLTSKFLEVGGIASVPYRVLSHVPVVIQPGPVSWGLTVILREGLKTFNRRLSLPGWGCTVLAELIPSTWDLNTNSLPAFLGPTLFALIMYLLSEFLANCFQFKILPLEKS